MKTFNPSLVLAAGIAVGLLALGPSASSAEASGHSPHTTVHGGNGQSGTGNQTVHEQHQQGVRETGTREENHDSQRGVRQGPERQNPPVVERRPDGDRGRDGRNGDFDRDHRNGDRDGRGGDFDRDHRNGDRDGRNGDHDPDRRPGRPVFVPGHDRDHPYRGHYDAPAGFGGREEWIDVHGGHHRGHFYCSPGWVPTVFFYYPTLGYWIDPDTGLVVYSAPAGLAPYTVVIDETVYEEIWDPILGQWVTVPHTVTYYYTAVWYPAAGHYGYTNYTGVVVYLP